MSADAYLHGDRIDILAAKAGGFLLSVIGYYRGFVYRLHRLVAGMEQLVTN